MDDEKPAGWQGLGGAEAQPFDATRFAGPAPTAPATVAKKNRRKLTRNEKVLAVAAVIVLAVAALMQLGSTDRNGQDRDPVGYQACASYASLVEDTRAGTVTTDEFRTRMESVYNDAKYAKTDAIASGAQQVLADETSGADDTADIAALASACSDLAG